MAMALLWLLSFGSALAAAAAAAALTALAALATQCSGCFLSVLLWPPLFGARHVCCCLVRLSNPMPFWPKFQIQQNFYALT